MLKTSYRVFLFGGDSMQYTVYECTYVFSFAQFARIYRGMARRYWFTLPGIVLSEMQNIISMRARRKNNFFVVLEQKQFYNAKLHLHFGTIDCLICIGSLY